MYKRQGLYRHKPQLVPTKISPFRSLYMHSTSLLQMVLGIPLIKRGGTAKVDKIDIVPNGWGSPLEVFEHLYKHECHVSQLVDKLVDVAAAEKDKATQDFLWGFVREQVEEEATVQGIVDKIKKAQ